MCFVGRLLNDMHPNGQSVCLAAKAQARVAYEPFRDEPEDEIGIMPLAEAERIMADLGGPAGAFRKP